MDEYGRCRSHWVGLGQRAMACEQEGQRMCDGISRCQKCRLEFLRERLRPEIEVNGIKL